MTKWTEKHPPQTSECPERFRSLDAWRNAIEADFEALDRYFIKKEELIETTILCYRSAVKTIEKRDSDLAKTLIELREREEVTDEEEAKEQEILQRITKLLKAYLRKYPDTLTKVKNLLKLQQNDFNTAKKALGNLTPPETYDEIEIINQKFYTLEFIDALESGDRDKLHHLLNNNKYLHPDIRNKSYELWLSPQEKQEQPEIKRETKVRFSDEVNEVYYKKDDMELYNSVVPGEETKWQKKEVARQQDDKKSILKKSIP